VRRAPDAPPEPPYDVTAWSLGMLVGADVVFVRKPLASSVALTKLDGKPALAGDVTGTGAWYTFDYRGPDAAIVVNRLLKDGARVAFDQPRGRAAATRVGATGVPRARMEALAVEFGLHVQAGAPPRGAAAAGANMPVRAPRVALYQSWTASMDEGWTRWVLEQYEFAPVTIHNADVRAGNLRRKFDAIVIADQQPRDILQGNSSNSTRPEYRGGIGDEGLEALRAFVADGGTLVTLGASCDLLIDRWPLPVRNLKRGLSRDEHYAPGTILRLQMDPTSPLGYGMAADAHGFYNNSPFFGLVEGFASQTVTVAARYPNADLVASGWLKGEELMAGRAAVVMVEMNPGRVVLFGIRPQHRAQTEATFPMLFNALYLAASGGPAS
jgi:hypothetical protein